MPTIAHGARPVPAVATVACVLAAALAAPLAGFGSAAADQHPTFTAALEQAAQANQLVVIDFYTSW